MVTAIMGCCNTHQLDRNQLELMHSQVIRSSPRSSVSHEFKDVDLDSHSEVSQASAAEHPFPLHTYADPVQSFHYFTEARFKRSDASRSCECSRDDTTVTKRLNRSYMNASEEEPSISFKLRLETSLADLQFVSLCQNLPHLGDSLLSPPMTQSPVVEGSNLSSISLEDIESDISFEDLQDEEHLREISVS